MKYYRSNNMDIKATPPENANNVELLNHEDEVIKIDLMPKEYAYLYALNHNDAAHQFSITYSAGMNSLQAFGALLLVSLAMF